METNTIVASGPETLLAACFVLLLGMFLVKKIKFLDTYNIPEPVAGGFIVAIGFLIAFKYFDFSISFNSNLQTFLMLAFFSSIGLSADFKRLIEGGAPLFIFLFVAAGLVVIQNTVGVTTALALGQDPQLGLIAGSVSLSGGHGTGAAWGKIFEEKYGITGVTELAIACATFGLVLGGMIGGPVAHRLIGKLKLQPNPESTEGTFDGINFENPKKYRQINMNTVISVVTMMIICIYVGTELNKEINSIPTFVWCLFTGVVIRNFLSHVLKYNVHDRAVDVLGNVGLSLFLAMALMSLKLWQLADLALPIIVILCIQTVVMVLYAYFVTFRVMGKDYDAAVLSAGHCGFGMGATPTAIANMQAITKTFGPSHKAFLIIPMVGAFFIDLINAAVITGFDKVIGG